MTLNWDFTYFFEAKTIYANSFVVKMMYAHFFVAKMIYVHFFCRKNDLHTRYMRFLLGKLFTHFIWKVFVHLYIFAIRKVHTFWDSAPQNPDKLADLSSQLGLVFQVPGSSSPKNWIWPLAYWPIGQKFA